MDHPVVLIQEPAATVQADVRVPVVRAPDVASADVARAAARRELPPRGPVDAPRLQRRSLDQEEVVRAIPPVEPAPVGIDDGCGSTGVSVT